MGRLVDRRRNLPRLGLRLRDSSWLRGREAIFRLKSPGNSAYMEAAGGGGRWNKAEEVSHRCCMTCPRAEAPPLSPIPKTPAARSPAATREARQPRPRAGRGRLG